MVVTFIIFFFLFTLLSALDSTKKKLYYCLSFQCMNYTTFVAVFVVKITEQKIYNYYSLILMPKPQLNEFVAVAINVLSRTTSTLYILKTYLIVDDVDDLY